MKIFKPNCEAVVTVLQQVLDEQKHLGKTLESVLSNKKLGARDRHFIAENVFEIVRYLRYYRFLTATLESGENNTANLLLAARLLHQKTELPEWFPVAENAQKEILENLKKRPQSSVFQSYSDWFYEQGEKTYGENWERIATALNESAAVCIRANTLKTTREKLRAVLANELLGIEQNAETKNGLVFHQHKKLTKHATYLSGWFEFQDISSQQVVEFCEAEAGDVVVDTCAGAGGKSLQLACEMNNRGKIYSLDIHEKKLMQLEERAKKAGAKIIEVFTVSAVVAQRLKNAADIVLIDAPCSGSGVIKRNPENKWNLEESRVLEIAKTQTEILQNYSSFVKPGGYLIYATCSILPQENQVQVQQFLAANKDFVFLQEQLLLPGLNTHYDGFYMAKLQRVIPQ